MIAEDQERCDSKPSRVIPFRSNSFQALVPQYLRPHRDYSPDDENRNDNKLLTFCSPNNLNSTPHGIKKYIFKDINHQQQGVCQNDFKANNNNNNSINNSAVTTVLNSIASTRQKLLSGDTRMLNSHPNAINHSKNSNDEDDGDDDDDVTINTRNHLNISTDDSSSSSSSFSDSKMQDKDCRWNNDDKLQAPLDIAKLRAIPKFLPRPIFDGKHKVHVCHKHKIEAQPLPEIILDQRQSPESPTGWSSSSEDDLYTDGSSVLSHNNQHIGSSDFNKVRSNLLIHCL